MKLQSGTVVNWSWIHDYGIIKNNKTGRELLLHYSNVKIKALDPQGNQIYYKGKPVYGRSEPPKGFFDDDGNELLIKPYGIWFDIGETVYYTIDNNKMANVAFNVTLKEPDTIQAYIDSRIQIPSYASSSSDDDDFEVNPTKSTPVRNPRRVGIPPSPGELLSPVKSPKREEKIKPNIFKTPVKKKPTVGIPPSPGD